MTDNVLPMPPRIATSGVMLVASVVVRDDDAFVLRIPLEPFVRERRIVVHADSIVLIDEDGTQWHRDIDQIHAAMRWLVSRGPLP